MVDLLAVLVVLAMVALIVGLIRPHWVIRWGGGDKTRLQVYGVASLVLLLLFGVVAPDDYGQPVADRGEAEARAAPEEAEADVDPAPEPSSEPIPTTRLLDGDDFDGVESEAWQLCWNSVSSQLHGDWAEPDPNDLLVTDRGRMVRFDYMFHRDDGSELDFWCQANMVGDEWAVTEVEVDEL